MSQGKRVCVIGAGPSGMSVLYHFNRLKTQGKEIPEVVCFDKQSDWGGLWNYSWQTGRSLILKYFLKIFINKNSSFWKEKYFGLIQMYNFCSRDANVVSERMFPSRATSLPEQKYRRSSLLSRLVRG